MAVVLASWFAVRAQQQASAGEHIPIDPDSVISAANGISQRSGHLKPMFEEVRAADWVAKGAPEAYVAQWKSLAEQNQAIGDDMTAIALHAAARQSEATPDAASLRQVLNAVFRVHRFDADLTGLLNAVRRYQNPALADLIESVADGDRNGIEKLQQYALDLAEEKDRQLDVVDKEAQRCRSTLAAQPVAHPAATKKTTPTPK